MSKAYLQIIGCGHSESIKLHNNNALVRSDQGSLLIDCGHTIKHALSHQDLSIDDIDAIYISHVHGDHVFGLERFAYECRYLYDKKIDLYMHKSIYGELWENTLKGSLGRNSEGECSLEDYFNVIFIENDAFEAFGVHYEIFPVKHTPGKPAYGLHINNDLIYTTDTTEILEVLQSRSFTNCFHDVSLTDFNPVHASIYSLIEKYPKNIKEKIWLMSYQDNFSEFEDIADNHFSGFAFEGQKVEIADVD